MFERIATDRVWVSAGASVSRTRVRSSPSVCPGAGKIRIRATTPGFVQPSS